MTVTRSFARRGSLGEQASGKADCDPLSHMSFGRATEPRFGPTTPPWNAGLAPGAYDTERALAQPNKAWRMEQPDVGATARPLLPRPVAAPDGRS